ncbi:MAG: exosortase/archaeosortase family protein [Verrucomicrobiae bacterium]|nr:exosortase/archaeosortase family protein [Verrucomicrobiae bacterium]
MSRRIPFLCLIAAVWALLGVHLAREWSGNPQYGYGWAVPILAAWILARRRGEWSLAPPHPDGPDRKLENLLWAGALALFPLELYRQVTPGLRGFGLSLALIALAITLLAASRLTARALPPVAWGVSVLILTAVPWPSSLEAPTLQGLMRGTAAVTAEILNWLGVLARPRGNLIELKTGLVGVNEACSGVRSIQACLMSAIALSLFFRLPWRRAASLVLIAEALALIGNLLRALFLVGVVASRGLSGFERWHDPAGVLIIVAVTLLIAGLARHWAVSPTHRPSPLVLRWERLPDARPALICGIAALSAAHLWYFAHERASPPREVPALAWSPAPGLETRAVQVPKEILDQLQPDRGSYYEVSWRTATDPAAGHAAVYHFFWKPGDDLQQAFAHRPDLCMPGAGWQIKGKVLSFDVQIGPAWTTWDVFHFERDGAQVAQAWGVWRDGRRQVLSYDWGWKKWAAAEAARWHYVWVGKRNANTEIASVAVPANTASEAELAALISKLFSWEGPR